jgi:dTDP-glucose pyrophosphorylase
MNIIVPMAGLEPQFSKCGQIKALVEIADRPVIEHVVENLRTVSEPMQFIFVVRQEACKKYHLDDVLRLLAPQSKIVTVQGETAGAACTAMLAIDHINPTEPLIVTNADQLLLVNLEKVIDTFQKKNLDGGTIIFNSVHPRWSYVQIDQNDLVIEAAEKWPISRNATAGFYYFKHGSDFINAVSRMLINQSSVNDIYYVCPTFNQMILEQKKIGVHRINRSEYVSLATPENIESYIQQLKGN